MRTAPLEQMMKILIVDDNYASRKLMLAYLESYGECTTANDGMEALKKLTEAIDGGEPFDLVCMDIMMPEMDGSEALKKLRNFEKERGVAPEKRTKVIMTSALDEREEIITLFNEGCEAYLIKPIDRERLNRVLLQLKLVPEED